MKAELVQKSRKEYRCSKCGKVIEKGLPYYRITGMYMPTRFRCAACKPERSELTTSEYRSWLYNLQDHFDDLYDFSDESVLESISDELSNQADELQGRLDEMPEAFQDTSDTGIQLSERIESLNDAQSEIDCLEYPDKEDEDYQVEDDEATFIFDKELAGDLAKVLTAYPNTEDAYTLDQVKEFMSAAKYVLVGEDDEDEIDTDVDNFSVTFRKEIVGEYGTGSEEVMLSFDRRTHFDEEAYQEAVDDLQSEVSDIISNITD